MKSVATRRFWDLFHKLPPEIQKAAVKSYRLWRQNPQHPSLHFRRLKGIDERFTIRVGDRYRALGRLRSHTITWVWIGTHAEYDKLTRAE
jgi:hypothetical protein